MPSFARFSMPLLVVALKSEAFSVPRPLNVSAPGLLAKYVVRSVGVIAAIAACSLVAVEIILETAFDSGFAP